MKQNNQINKIVLAYSGGLDTSVCVAWLKEKYNCQVITFSANVGQGDEELAGVKQKALKSGASKAYVLDLTQEFIEDYMWPTLKAGAKYEGYLLGTAVARPVIAKHLVAIAKAEKADAVAHGCTGKGNDQVRFDLAVKALAPDLTVIAPWRQWEITSRKDALAYAAKHNIPLKFSAEDSYSRDRNLWHLSHEGLDLEDPGQEPKHTKLLKMGVTPQQAPDKSTAITISFTKGIPTAINSQPMPGVEIVKLLNNLGGKNGIGVLDLVENRLVGMKNHGLYETPGGTILYHAHSKLESITLDKDTAHYKQQVALKFGELVYNGLWFTPLRAALSKFVDATQQHVTGEVKLKLYKGNIIDAGVTSPYSLYDPKIASFDDSSMYNQADSIGFINLFGLPIKVQAKMKGEVSDE
ncbi:argininosuccinate synthase [Candidatus Saccharibacteria bacterium]|nr:argininosuccinate synthase [Candidatus Saccharibacteria bacterium]